MLLSLTLFLWRLYRHFSIMFSSERLTVPEYVSRLQRGRSGSGSEPKAVSPGVRADVQLVLDGALPALRCAIQRLKSSHETSDSDETRRAIAELFQLVEEAWVLPTVGRQVAEDICNRIRLDGGLELLLQLQQNPALEITYESAKLLEQILTSENRDYVARMGLGVVLNLTRHQEDAQLARSVSGILEHMFKHTEETSVHLISNGALDALLFWCRGTDPTVLRHCAVALANCAMYGGHRCQRWMIEKQAAEWLFPLAFSKEDEIIRFHACLAVTVLAANREIEKEVVKSGTLELVEPFIASLDPDDFARSLLDSSDNMQGRTAADLQHFLPLLDGTRLEGKCIAAFYLCVEASIKSRQGNTKIFQEIGAVQSLKKMVMYSSNGTACGLAKRALSVMGEEVPRRILSCVPNWKTCEVRTWLQQVGFSAYCDRFQELQVDGDLLLNITDQELCHDLGMTAGLSRKRFLRDLCVLKTYANYSTCDPNNMADWLVEVDPRFRQYTYGLVQSGVDRNNFKSLTDQQLQNDCHIDNGVHRAKILSANNKPLKPCQTDAQPAGPDVFISYRRTTGSQLASLLKVHLQVRGYSVFIDVEKLEAGKFEDKLIQSVQRARNFILVLSSNALDKCMGDTDMKDWVHKVGSFQFFCIV
ncbi:NAD(+) hydrolase SARM1 [Notothenia coriiceps]|uniref:NAD(+) hydrolase SARM1 n=1 Tax=Notothenia coriiceps TaxID=8208 RepID=A0A6I9Q104_9TELE|nr:PREDICTED: sterile alpha and TIR motif-containing protein 1 [Notothenia coriiceps]XP_010794259.1 PREDICTED: sterile alpha and TIR motif-containing protein 1 [Notothenia coriiceps]XP_010794260.1 PREDICTED: sterile alpha and TIR motif-containing protein 1 [Notothenia coriiceps]XP_010794262.1 PREDICTED: sterile alpha and TIR motif-containing protein 1 [Notothenia coriiceps]